MSTKPADYFAMLIEDCLISKGRDRDMAVDRCSKVMADYGLAECSVDVKRYLMHECRRLSDYLETSQRRAKNMVRYNFAHAAAVKVAAFAAQFNGIPW
jgi:hypothetical protein